MKGQRAEGATSNTPENPVANVKFANTARYLLCSLSPLLSYGNASLYLNRYGRSRKEKEWQLDM